MNSRPQQRYEFGPFRLDTSEHSLCRDGQVVPLEPKAFNLLKVLVQNNGRLLQKEDLLKEVWPDAFVEEGNVNRNISILRKVLGEHSSGETYIETVPKRGYRFVATVKTMPGNGIGSVDAEPVDQDAQAKGRPDLLHKFAKRDFVRRKARSARWLVLAGAAGLTLGILLYVSARRQSTVATRPEIKSIAVLPLENLSDDPAQEYFADGMTEALISSLAQIRALRVISRTSVMGFKGSQKPLPEIARELKVDGVIEGSVQRENGRVKVMIQLIHGPTDTHLWARDYERELTDVLRLQGEMARAIGEEIRIQVTPEDQSRISSAADVNPAAHQAYLLGRYHFWKFIIDDHRRAIEHFKRATEIDPSYAAAYAGLSMAWQVLGVQSLAMKEAEPPARAAAQKALQLDNRLPEAHVAQGYLQFLYDWDWRRGENAFRRALELNPNSVDGHHDYASLLMAIGRFPEAITEIQTAEQLDPLSHQVQAAFGRILCRAGKPDEAILRLKRAIEREPRSAMAHHYLGEVYEQLGRYTEALAIYDKARILRGNRRDNPPFLSILARVYARMDKRSEAKGILARLGDDAPGPVSQAAAYAALGDTDEAFRLLFRRVKKRADWAPMFIKTDPQFAGLRSDPRWPELLSRINLPIE